MWKLLAKMKLIVIVGDDKDNCYLNSRFSEQAMDLLTLSCALTPKDNYKNIQLCYQLEQFFVDTHKEPCLKNLSTIQDLCSCLVATERNKIYFLIDRLLRLIMTLPVSTATTEKQDGKWVSK
ncbi:hypothetical protein MTR_7g086390 [Medicago truncatula]|uniref:Uncharacterized protein n=1 Tax=Medicago truncatula TaxID=3880 RepID=G7L0J8_MEDTR|nr:hypothetical protein MTR_7g086390 [Medicago truncatula]